MLGIADFLDGEFYGVVGYRDIIQHLVKHSHRTSSVYSKLEQLDALTLSTAGIAHDLNNVLTAMQSQRFLLGRVDDLSTEIKECLDGIDHGIAMAADLVRSLQLYAKNGIVAACNGDLVDDVRETVVPNREYWVNRST